MRLKLGVEHVCSTGRGNFGCLSTEGGETGIPRPVGSHPASPWRNALIVAMTKAVEEPITGLEEYTDQYRMVMSMAYHLQRERPDQNIFLPCHALAELLGCVPDTISRYRKSGERNGLLKRGPRGSLKQRKADEFTFALDRFDSHKAQQLARAKENMDSKSGT